jgi:hypothetical protein
MIGKSIRNLIVRAHNSAVVWNWVLNGLRVGQGIIVLPLLVHFLHKPEFGMYYVLLGLSALIPVLDFGFSYALGRNVSYAMAGATELKAEGVSAAIPGAKPNFTLLWELLHTMRFLYRRMALIAFVVISVVGTVVVGMRAHETTSPVMAWTAWAITLVAVVWELYSGWWRVYLQGLNEVVPAARIAVIGSVLNITISAVLLVCGAGLLSVPIGSLIGSFCQRELARKACLRLLGLRQAPPSSKRLRDLFWVVWPNTWKLGLQFTTGYLITKLIIFLKVFDLADNAEFGLSAQVLSVIQGVSVAWMTVKWPLVSQYRAQRDYEGLRRLLWPRIWVQAVTYFVLATAFVFLGQELLIAVGSSKRVLPTLWLGMLALDGYMQMRLSFWGMLISTENRLPFVYPMIVMNVCSVLIAIALLHFTNLRFGALVLAPFIAGMTFNYWFWPIAAAKTVRSSWFRFVFLRKSSEAG